MLLAFSLLYFTKITRGEMDMSGNKERLVQFEVEEVVYYVTVEREKHSTFFSNDATLFMDEKVVFIKDMVRTSAMYTKLPTLEDRSWGKLGKKEEKKKKKKTYYIKKSNFSI